MGININNFSGIYSNRNFLGAKSTSKKDGVDVQREDATSKLSNVSSESNTKVNNLSSKNEEKLSKKAQDYLEQLREQYGNYDFMVGNTGDDLQTIANSGTKEFSIIFSNDELEKMANDAEYASKKMDDVEGAVSMSRRIAEESGFGIGQDLGNGMISKISIFVDDNGSMKLFAQLEKSTLDQKSRIQEAHQKHNKEKKAKDAEQKDQMNSSKAKDTKHEYKKTVFKANSYDDLLEQLKSFSWEDIAVAKPGDKINFQA